MCQVIISNRVAPFRKRAGKRAAIDLNRLQHGHAAQVGDLLRRFIAIQLNVADIQLGGDVEQCLRLLIDEQGDGRDEWRQSLNDLSPHIG